MARSPDKQAHWAAIQMSRHGESRADTRGTPGLSSVGTTVSYEQSLRQVAAWQREHRAGDLRTLSPDQARQYLAERAQVVGQATLDRDRQAIQSWISHRDGSNVRMERVQSAHAERGLAQESRLYTRDQVERIAARQSASHALATDVAAEGGLRASEIATIRPLAERPAADREWSPERWRGREHWERYSVVGKGGLTREVRLSPETAQRLEAARLEQPRTITDRGIYRETQYQIGHGKAWSDSFSKASQAELGWSRGAHSLRHGYAQERMAVHQRAGLSYEDAKAQVAQEVGHFRDSTTDAYLR